MAVGAAPAKEARHDHTHRPHTLPPCTVYTGPEVTSLTNNLAKLGLQIGRPGGVGGAAGPQDRAAAGREEREGIHGLGRAGWEGWEGWEGRRRQGGSVTCRNGSSGSSGRRHATDRK